MKITTQSQQLQARFKKERLHDFCREHGLSTTSILRVAHHTLYDEDVLQEPPFAPNGILAPSQEALLLALDALRLQYKATANEPESKYRTGWWECPSMASELERVRREHNRRKESGVSEWDDFVAELPEFLRSKLQGDRR